MSSPAIQDDSDDEMDLFMDKSNMKRYNRGFNEDTWEEVRHVRHTISSSQKWFNQWVWISPSIFKLDGDTSCCFIWRGYCLLLLVSHLQLCLHLTCRSLIRCQCLWNQSLKTLTRWNTQNWPASRPSSTMKTGPQKVSRRRFLHTVATSGPFVNIAFGLSTEQVNCLKNEGNEFFKEKKYEKAIICYTAALKKNCGDQEVNTVLLTNRAAAQFYLGILSSFYFWKLLF